MTAVYAPVQLDSGLAGTAIHIEYGKLTISAAELPSVQLRQEGSTYLVNLFKVAKVESLAACN